MSNKWPVGRRAPPERPSHTQTHYWPVAVCSADGASRSKATSTDRCCGLSGFLWWTRTTRWQPSIKMKGEISLCLTSSGESITEIVWWFNGVCNVLALKGKIMQKSCCSKVFHSLAAFEDIDIFKILIILINIMKSMQTNLKLQKVH